MALSLSHTQNKGERGRMGGTGLCKRKFEFSWPFANAHLSLLTAQFTFTIMPNANSMAILFFDMPKLGALLEE
jgi:hypothetical protein